MAAPQTLALRDGVAVVTGAAGGIGAALAQALARRGCHLALADVEWLMAINFWAPLRLTHAFLPQLKAAPAAQVVNVSSIFGIIAPPGQSAYAASKFALRGFSESLRHELDGTTVGVTLVHPGGVRTGIASSAKPPREAGADDLAREQAAWARLLTLAPEAAAERIVRAIERREPRVLVGRDAARAAMVQRLFPVGYWKLVARDLARRIGRTP